MTTSVTNIRSLYRSLLRETTYLFDPAARKYCHEYITSSFRNHVLPPKKPLPTKVGSSSEPSAIWLPSKDESRRLKRGRKFLSLLERANQGYMIAVTNVLKLTYGRTGRRRRELMTSIMAAEPSDALDEGPRTSMSMKTRSWKPPTKFYDLMMSQSRMKDHLAYGTKVKPDPKVPEKNRQGRNMPSVRVKNMHKRWYADVAARLLPPLPEQERDAIRSVATGGILLRGKKRRVQGTTGVLNKTKDLSISLQDLETFLVDGPAKDPAVDLRKKIKGNAHRLTPRFLRRRFAGAVLKHTPVARMTQEGKLWYEWDDGFKSRRLARACTDSQAVSLFE